MKKIILALAVLMMGSVAFADLDPQFSQGKDWEIKNVSLTRSYEVHVITMDAGSVVQYCLYADGAAIRWC